MRLQFGVVPRLADEAVDLAVVDRADDRREVGVTGEQDAHAARRDVARLPQQIDAGHDRHALVADDDVHLVAAQEVERLVAVGGREHVIAVAEQRLQRGQDALLVVDHQQPALFHAGFEIDRAVGGEFGRALGRGCRRGGRRRRGDQARRVEQGRRIRRGRRRCGRRIQRRIDRVAEGVGEFLGAVKTVFAFFRQRLEQHLVDQRRQLRFQFRRRLGVIVQHLLHDDCRIAGEGLAPGQQFVGDDADRIEVGMRVDFGAEKLFGRHVMRRAEHVADLRQVGRLDARDAEVADLDAAVAVDEDIRRLDVAVHDAFGVGMADAVEQLAR